MGTTISFYRFAALCAFGLALPYGAQAQNMYRCVDANGHKLYTDVKKGNCEVIFTASSVPPVPAASAPIPAVRPSGSIGPAPSASPVSFPRVDSAQQRVRDDGRREILNDELRAEQKKLADLRKDFNGGEPERMGNERNYVKYQERVASMRDEIGRTERNIDALQREITNIR